MEWSDYFAGFARHAALKSKDSTQVGAVLVGPEGEIRLTGFNGPRVACAIFLSAENGLKNTDSRLTPKQI